MRDDRRTYRRVEKRALIIIGGWVAFAPFAFWLILPNVALAVCFVAGFTAGLWLTGPVVSVTVTAQDIIVRNTLHTWTIARSLVTRPDDHDAIHLLVAGHRSVEMSAFEYFFKPRLTGGHEPVSPGIGWLTTALTEVPALPDDGQRRFGPHWGNVLLGLITVAGLVEAWRLVP
ncbi:hypothetical protein [Paractinoplanes lichenicola]|uniref:Uncharacterized protein n=1 Tax=Paractinoplanes lichenicola TaxID=2802976 RepID=A0ABS1VNQ6_9ACTN|nr:hypothetical protein [Actinoplanes lichenicola]MBL7255840.1 hypothetical protein [Actinoplanes lichenicola]